MLLLVEEDLNKLSEEKKAVFILQWIQDLPRTITTISKSNYNDLKSKQKELIQQLVKYGLQGGLSSPVRSLLASSYVAVYQYGDTVGLYDVVNKCIELIKLKDEGNLANKYTAITCLGAIFSKHGRMVGSLFLEATQVLLKAGKTNELRCDVCQALEGILTGLGSSATSVHKDIYKFIKNALTDKQLSVRAAAANCTLQLAQHGMTYYTQDLDSLSQICLKAFEGSDYKVRCAVAGLWGSLLSLSQTTIVAQAKGKIKLEDVFGLLSQGFIRGSSGFLKAGGPELLKGGMASKDVRVGVTMTHVFFVQEMGGKWLERHLSLVSHHVLDLLAHQKAISTHIDAVYSRKCVQFIFRSTFGSLLSESTQLIAAIHLCKVISQLSSGSVTATINEGSEADIEPTSDVTKSVVSKQHMMICAAMELSSLIEALNTAASPLIISDSGTVGGDNSAPLIEALDCILINQSLASRLSGARCLHYVGLALPSQLTLLLNYLLVKCKTNRGHPLGLVGYSHALSSLLGTARSNELGVPLKKAQEVLQLGLELIKTPNDRGNLSVASIQSGWALIGSFLSLGVAYVRNQLREVFIQWYQVFPHSHNDLIAEINTGTSLSWQHTLENRMGALTSLTGFLTSCGDTLPSDIIKKLMLPLDSSLALVSELSSLIKTHGVQLKALSAGIRRRLYQNFILLPPSSYEGCYQSLLREIVAEITLTDMSTTTTSLLRSMCHHDDSILLGSWLEETDHQNVEEMLQPNSAAGSGAIEHDSGSVYLPSNESLDFTNPLPLGVAVIDASITLFGHVFPALSSKHQLQLLNHFKECTKQAKQPVQINVITAVLSALKGLIINKSSFAGDELISVTYSVITGALTSSNAMLRCAAGEALGRLSQVVGDGRFVGQIVQRSVEALKNTKDIPTGHILALGCLHRYVGGMNSGPHLSLSVSTLQDIVKSSGGSIAQVWSLHALSLIADSGGPLFRNFVDSTLSLLLSLLLYMPTISIDMYRCLGNCLSALLTTLGPELQIESKGMSETRTTCLTACGILQNHSDPVVQAASISCIQQLQLFAPKLVAMATIVPHLHFSLDSPHLLLRRSAANALRQFSQQEPKLIWTLLLKEENNLEQTVLSKLDVESDEKLRFDLKEILFSLLSALAPNDPMRWLLMCNGVLSAASQNEGEGGMSLDQPPPSKGDDQDEDMAQFTTGEDKSVKTAILPKWPTKVFAVECSRKIYQVCLSDQCHFDQSLAQAKKESTGGDYLVMHLSELVRTSFIAATASVDALKLAGYQALQDVIQLFANAADPEYPGHVLLELYQAQIGAALRPAFTPDTAPHVTAMACQVCSEWLGSGVSKHVSDLKRVQQLLVTSLAKLKSEDTSLYGEAVATMESLAVLKAWAELYIKISTDEFKKQMTPEPGNKSEAGDDLIEPHLSILSQYWLSAINDYAQLLLPDQFSNQLPPNGGVFYIAAMAPYVRLYYESDWAPILEASSLWANKNKLKETKLTNTGNAMSLAPPFASMLPLATDLAPPTDERHDMFYLLMGMAVQALCNPALYDSTHTIKCCLNSVHYLIKTSLAHSIMSSDKQLLIEILNVLHRVVLTSRDTNIHLESFRIALSLTSELSLDVLEEKIEEDQSCAYTLLVLASWALLKPSQNYELISLATLLLPNVLHWIAPTALSKVLPSVIYIILSIVPSLQKTQFSSLIYQSWKDICQSSSSDSSLPILQSALKTLLISDDTQLMVLTRLVLISILLVTVPDVCTPSFDLFQEFVGFMKKCLQDTQDIQMKGLQVCSSLFTVLSPLFIHELAPEIIELFKDTDTTEDITVQASQSLETLLDLTPDDKKSMMLGLLVPLFISRLSFKSSVQSVLLQKLTAIGRKYPIPFRNAMTPQLKAQLEAAIKTSSATTSSTSKGQPVVQQRRGTSKAQPSIALKMDFSNFK